MPKKLRQRQWVSIDGPIVRIMEAFTLLSVGDEGYRYDPYWLSPYLMMEKTEFLVKGD